MSHDSPRSLGRALPVEGVVRVLVCGGRDFADQCAVDRCLDGLHDELGITRIIEGGARGADRFAYEWGAINCVRVEHFVADWKTHGRAAGPIRNQQMLEEGEPDLVVAFPGGRGTADMIRRAKAAGLKVLEPHP